MTTARPRLPLSDEALKEITRRATNGDDQAESWAQYLLLLRMASNLLEGAPKTSEACEDLDIERHVGDEIEAIVSTLHRLLPGGLREAWSYYAPGQPERSSEAG